SAPPTRSAKRTRSSGWPSSSTTPTPWRPRRFAAASSRPRPMRAADTRIRGLDIARGVAVLGMFTAHTISVSEPVGAFAVLDELAGGTRPRMLFALVSGISLGLLLAGPPRG